MKQALKAMLLAVGIALSIGAAHAAKEDAPAATSDKGMAKPPQAAAGKDAGKAANNSAAAMIDLNSASEAELMTLPQIGDARAKAIVQGRPYSRKDELVSKKIVTQGVYNGIKDKVVARQGSDKAAPAKPGADGKK
jgi:DNA uptake protein ComE-like DNA-binding protein